jgi:hypothetical protein
LCLPVQHIFPNLENSAGFPNPARHSITSVFSSHHRSRSWRSVLSEVFRTIASFRTWQPDARP